jgi:hypothetical protein
MNANDYSRPSATSLVRNGNLTITGQQAAKPLPPMRSPPTLLLARERLPFWIRAFVTRR